MRTPSLDELLAGLTEGQKRTAKAELVKLKGQLWDQLNIKKIGPNTYRVKRGRVRIFYKKLPQGKFIVLEISLRDSQTYSNY